MVRVNEPSVRLDDRIDERRARAEAIMAGKRKRSGNAEALAVTADAVRAERLRSLPTRTPRCVS